MHKSMTRPIRREYHQEGNPRNILQWWYTPWDSNSKRPWKNVCFFSKRSPFLPGFGRFLKGKLAVNNFPRPFLYLAILRLWPFWMVETMWPFKRISSDLQIRGSKGHGLNQLVENLCIDLLSICQFNTCTIDPLTAASIRIDRLIDSPKQLVNIIDPRPFHLWPHMVVLDSLPRL